MIFPPLNRRSEISLLLTWGIISGILIILSFLYHNISLYALIILLIPILTAIIIFLIKNSDLTLFFYVFVIPITRQAPYHKLISTGLLLVFLLFYLILKFKAHHISFVKLSPLLIFSISIYLISLLISICFSQYKKQGLIQFGREVIFFILFYFLCDRIRSPKQWNLVAASVGWVGIGTSLSIMFSLLLGGYISSNLRLSGIFTSPTAAGLAISLPFPITLSYLQGQVYLKVPYARMRLAAFVALSLIASVLTVSRITIIAVLLGILLASQRFLIQNLRSLALVVLIMALIITPIAVALGWTKDAATYLRLDRGLSGRGFLWQQAWHIFCQHPLVGTGPSTYRYYVLPREVTDRFGSVDEILALHAKGQLDPAAYYGPIFGGVIGNSPHNLPLSILSNIGIIGFISACFLISSIWYIGRKKLSLLSQAKDTTFYWVVRGCVWTIAIQMVRVQFEEPGIFGGGISTSLLFWAAVALIVRSSAVWNREKTALYTAMVSK